MVTRRHFILGSVAGAAALGAGALAASGQGRRGAVPADRGRLPPLPAGVIRGVCYAHDWSDRGARGYGTESDAAQLRRLRDLGATWVSVTPFGFLPSATATAVRGAYDRRGAETDAALATTIARAKALGLRVLLKPHLWVRGSWPGALRPPGAAGEEALMRTWSALALHYADLAARAGADALTLGVEMDPLAFARPDLWTALAAAVRARYAGMITYAANWGAQDRVAFWAALDAVAIQAYAPLADGPGADRAAVLRRARAVMAGYAATGRRAGRPVWLTELGFRRDGEALVRPWVWPGDVPPAALARDDQALGYEAALRAVAAEPGVHGVFLWKWFSSGGYEDDGARGFVFNGAPAEGVVRAAFRPPA